LNPNEIIAERLVYDLPNILEPVNLRCLFPQEQPLEIELGSGDGSFLTSAAAKCPERNFIGVERLLGRVQKTERKGLRAGLSNMRIVRIESAYFLEYLLPRHSSTAIHIYFPDPWPKRKHRRHRLINERFPTLAAQALVPGGTLYLRTDDSDYFAQMKSVFAAVRGFQAELTPEALASLVTDFERDFNAQGIPTLRAAYRKL